MVVTYCLNLTENVLEVNQNSGESSTNIEAESRDLIDSKEFAVSYLTELKSEEKCILVVHRGRNFVISFT